MYEAKRQEIKDRVAEGEARHRAREDAGLLDRAGETAIEAKDRFTAFAREHPLTTIAGGLAIGVLISGMFPRSPTRKLGGKAVGLAALGAEAAKEFLQEALEAAGHAASDAGRAASTAATGAGVAASQAGRAGRHRLEDLGDTIVETARSVRRSVAHSADDVADEARSTRRHTGKRLRRHTGKRLRRMLRRDH